MNRSPLLDFRERRVDWLTLFIGANLTCALFMACNEIRPWCWFVGTGNLLAAKYLHSKLPVKRKRKEKTKAVEEDLFQGEV